MHVGGGGRKHVRGRSVLGCTCGKKRMDFTPFDTNPPTQRTLQCRQLFSSMSLCTLLPSGSLGSVLPHRSSARRGSSSAPAWPPSSLRLRLLLLLRRLLLRRLLGEPLLREAVAEEDGEEPREGEEDVVGEEEAEEDALDAFVLARVALAFTSSFFFATDIVSVAAASFASASSPSFFVLKREPPAPFIAAIFCFMAAIAFVAAASLANSALSRTPSALSWACSFASAAARATRSSASARFSCAPAISALSRTPSALSWACSFASAAAKAPRSSASARSSCVRSSGPSSSFASCG